MRLLVGPIGGDAGQRGDLLSAASGKARSQGQRVAPPFSLLTPYDALRIALALVLLGAAALKGYQLATEPMITSGLLTSGWFLIAVVQFESLFGFWLLAGFYPRETRWASLGCFFVFACVSLYKALTGEASCGCFGGVQVSPWRTLTLDAAAVTALCLCRPIQRFGAAAGLTHYRMALLGAALASGAVLGGATIGSRAAVMASDGEILVGGGGVVVLAPDAWVGKRLPLLKYLSRAEELAEGDWLVVLYRHDCPKCHALLQQYAVLAGRAAPFGTSSRVGLVELPPYRSAGGAAGLGAHGVFEPVGRLPDEYAWFVETPTVLALREGVVVRVYQGDAAPRSARMASRR